MTPFISVIVPVYKTEPYLRQCVDSILTQTLAELELILVEDGSPDGCPAICDEYAAKDPRVKVIHKPNGGVASAIVAGLRAATADYVGFIDSDDRIDPDYYGELYRCITSSGADIVEGQIIHEFPSESGFREIGSYRSKTVTYSGSEDIQKLSGLYMLSFLYDGMPDKPDRPLSYSKCDKLFRKELIIQNLPYYSEKLSLGEDALLIAAVVPDCGKVVTLQSEAKYRRLILAGSVSHKSDESQIQRITEVWKSLRTVTEEKSLDKPATEAFIGSMVHARIYRTAELPDTGTGEKCRRMRRMLREAPPGTLGQFVRARGSLFLWVFYTLLRLGFAAPCVWIVTLHKKISG